MPPNSLYLPEDVKSHWACVVRGAQVSVDGYARITADEDLHHPCVLIDGLCLARHLKQKDTCKAPPGHNTAAPCQRLAPHTTTSTGTAA